MERNCKNCKNQDCFWIGLDDDNICDEFLPKTNADRIRCMTDEELAKWMSANVANYACHKFSEMGVIEKYGDNGLIAKSWLDWLKEEYK